MKKYCLSIALLSVFLNPAFATTNAGDRIQANIGIKNTTNDPINVSCTISGVTMKAGAKTLSPGASFTFTDDMTPCDTGDDSRYIKCKYTDNATGNKGSFQFDYTQILEPYTQQTYDPTTGAWTLGGSCQTPTLSSETPPTPYTCKYSNCTMSPTVSYCGSVKYPVSDIYAPTVYFAIGLSAQTYELVWTNVTTSLVKGQTMANKLAASLANHSPSLSIIKSTYINNTLTIEGGAASTNPYIDAKKIQDCKAALSA